ncbi:MAG: DUF3530 family protein [Gammaproteobacteria bacterium]|nr:DUF3530 family protein [Gammaproteobacteria bacterium]
MTTINMIKSACLCLLLTVSWSVSVAMDDDSYEQTMSVNLAEKVQDGEVIWLKARGSQFLTLFNEQLTENSQGAVIIVHGMGAHADWPNVVAPLRNRLPNIGWATLSIQMPVLAPEQPLSEYGKTITVGISRIQSAVQYLRQRKFLNIAIIGYSFGAATAAEFLARTKKSRIAAFVGISLQAQKFLNPTIKLLRALEKINIPVLDIYGSRDFTEVIRLADDRRLAGRKRGRRTYHQLVIEGADHYFTGLEDVLSRRIRGWLDKAAPGTRVIADKELEEKIKADEEEDDEQEQ